MKEILDDIERWRLGRQAGGRRPGRRHRGLRPARPGAAMAVSEDGEVAGSVSGGCVEGAVVTEALDVLETGEPGRLVTFGYSDDEAFAVGPHLRRHHPPVHRAARLVTGDGVALRDPAGPAPGRAARGAGHRASTAPHVGAKLLVAPDEEPLGTLGHPDLDRVVARDALAELEAGRTGVRHYGTEGQTTPTTPPSRA